MNSIMLLLGLAVMIAGVVFFFLPKIKKSAAAAMLIAGVVIAVSGQCFAIVPTGYTGVRTTFGQISEANLPQGFNLKVPFIQSVNLVNNKQQDISLSAQVWGETKEKVPVFAEDVIVTYQIAGNRSSWIYANVSQSDQDLVSAGLVSSSIKSAMVELGVQEVTIRTHIEPLVKEKLQAALDEKYGAATVNVLKVVINNMNFEEEYNQAIDEKSIAQQVYEKQQIENETRIAKAEADAKALMIEAQAQAQANETLSQSLTENVLLSKFYEKWDGKLPQVMGEHTVITAIGEEIAAAAGSTGSEQTSQPAN